LFAYIGLISIGLNETSVSSAIDSIFGVYVVPVTIDLPKIEVFIIGGISF